VGGYWGQKCGPRLGLVKNMRLSEKQTEQKKKASSHELSGTVLA
jgi:hypothetical protein